MHFINLLGIHSTNYEENLSLSFFIYLSTSLPDTDCPLNKTEPVKIFPNYGLLSHIKDRGSNIIYVISCSLTCKYLAFALAIKGAYPYIIKCSLGNGIKFVHIFLMSELFWIPGNLIDAVEFDIPYATI